MSSLEVRDHRRRLNGTRVDLQLRGRVSAPRNSLSRCKDLQPAAPSLVVAQSGWLALPGH